MTTTADTYTIRGVTPESYGVTDSPELRDLLEYVETDAWDAGNERGFESGDEYAYSAAFEAFEPAVEAIRNTAACLTRLAGDYAVANGSHLTMPDEHEQALVTLSASLTAILNEIGA